MTRESCSERQGDLAAGAMGHLSETEMTELRAHLDVCESCAAIFDELSMSVRALDVLQAQPEITSVPVPASLSAAVLGNLERESAPRNHRRRLAYLGVVSIAAVSVALVGVLIASGPTRSHPPKTLALSGSSRVKANVSLVATSWGTSLTLRQSAGAADGTYTVAMETVQGKWWTAGSYWVGGKHSIEAQMACAASLTSFEGIRITDDKGRVVLSSYQEARPPSTRQVGA